MEGHVDNRMVKSVILAAIICTGSYYTLYLLFGLLQGYIDIFAIALVTSLAIRPLKDTIQANFLIHYTSPDAFSMLQGSILVNPLKFIRSSATSVTSYLIVILLAYLTFRTSKVFIICLVGLILLSDLSLRLLYAFIMKLIKLLNLNEYHDFFDTVLTIFLMISMVVLVLIFQTFAIGSVVVELSENGSAFYSWFIEHFDQDMIDSLKLDSYFDTVKSNISEIMGDFTKIYQVNNKKCSIYIQNTSNLPIIGQLIFEFSSELDELLIPLELSTEHLVFLYLQVPDKLSIIWKLISYILKLVFNNLGGVAVTLSLLAERVILYFTLVYILIKDNTSMLEKVLNVLPINNKTRHEIHTEVISTIAGISSSFILAAFAHYGVTLWLYYILGIPFRHTFAVLTGIVGLFPFFGAWFVNLPMILWLSIQWEPRGIILLLIEYFVVGYLDSFIYTAHLNSYNPTLIGIVIVLGIYKFGTFGIFYGPLILCAGYLVFKLGKQITKTDNN